MSNKKHLIVIKPFKETSGKILNYEANVDANTTGDMVVLHFDNTYDAKKLMQKALMYGWEFYRYASDGHIGLFINEGEIFRIIPITEKKTNE